jgi:uncharacterized phage protein (TIGR02218 family)
MGAEQLYAHLLTGATTVCRAWALTRKDGEVLGFTDHDQDLEFGGIVFKADTGLTARSLQQQTGLSVDNTEAIGGLSDDAITEADLMAGRFDGADVKAWMVNWQSVGARVLQFSGNIGEITHVDGRFTAELRSLVDRLNQPRGRVYHRGCSAILGDRQCKFDLGAPGFSRTLPLIDIDSLGRLVFAPVAGLAVGWFDRGRLIAQSGAAAGLSAVIKIDKIVDGKRRIELWDQLGASPTIGDLMLLQAGCNKLAATCQTKFDNFLNFRGFPHIPGEDWMMSYPVSFKNNDGGSMFK